MGALTRNVAELDAEMRAGKFGSQMGVEVTGRILGIIGFGAIGRQVAKIASFGFGMKVLAADVRQFKATAIELLKKNFGIDTYTNDIDAVLRQADIVSIHMPGIPETRHFFNAGRLATMKPGAILVNTARGTVVDECALYDALVKGPLAGAGLDVFEQEPYIPPNIDKDLRRLNNIVLTPHIGSNTRESNQRMASKCLSNIDNFFSRRMEELNVV